eukprot:m.463377 g.463377  ORF g.463377 m.463377 type:complete len:371 (+) comp23006_c0_seq1:457-1569(+)
MAVPPTSPWTGPPDLNEASATSPSPQPPVGAPGAATGAAAIPFGSKAYTPSERHSIQSHLERPLGGENVMSRAGPGGQRVEYIQASTQFEMANLAFGYNGWSTQIKDFTVDFCGQDKKGLWEVGVAVVVRVLLQDGSFHEDIGYGDARGPSRPMVFGNARKAAVTDATKRALRLFGPAVGLCMADKEFLKQAKTDKKVAPKKEFKNPVRQNEAFSDAHPDVLAAAAAAAVTTPPAAICHQPESARPRSAQASPASGPGRGGGTVPATHPTPSTAPVPIPAAPTVTRLEQRHSRKRQAVAAMTAVSVRVKAVGRGESDDEDDAAMLLAGEEFESAMLAASELTDDEGDDSSSGAGSGSPSKRARAEANVTK